MNMNLEFKNSKPYTIDGVGYVSDKDVQLEIAKQACNIANELKRINDNIDFVRELAIAQFLEHADSDAEYKAKTAKRDQIEAWRPHIGDKIKIIASTTKGQESDDVPFKVGTIMEVTKIDLTDWDKKIELTANGVSATEPFECLKRKLEWDIIEIVKEA